MPNIQFNYLIPVPELLHRRELKSFLKKMASSEKYSLISLQVIFCNDDYLLKMNQEFLGHDYYTDIITFPLSKPGEPIEAELYISVDRTRDNASALGVSRSRELHRVIFHGLLHLLGYKDKLKTDQDTMRVKEDFYLARYKM
ncbi:rRNA maturation RNase YbeY [Pollutibacter soli]|uniref:rRNA maturation RNase YbeY n=1 Tax=Pollutibacter soli TaxID=3034157 RepID=UPI003013E316